MTESAAVVAGRAAAFHGRPADGIATLSDVVLGSDLRPDSDAPPEATWLLGVCHSSAGDYGAALAVLGPLARGSSAPGPVSTDRRHYGALAATTIASVYRQLSMHTLAQPFDQRALAAGDGDPVVEFDASLGLAADSVGKGNLELAQDYWQRARRAAQGQLWRQWVRLDWVDTEIALMSGQSAQAMGAARHAVDAARQAQAPRHLAKSLLFAAVAGLASDEPNAHDWLIDAAQLASDLGCYPLVWPAELVLSRSVTDPVAIRAHQSAALLAVRTILANLPAALAISWRSQPEISGIFRSSSPNE